MVILVVVASDGSDVVTESQGDIVMVVTVVIVVTVLAIYSGSL